jgi:hypothetical protein
MRRATADRVIAHKKERYTSFRIEKLHEARRTAYRKSRGNNRLETWRRDTALPKSSWTVDIPHRPSRIGKPRGVGEGAPLVQHGLPTPRYAGPDSRGMATACAIGCGRRVEPLLAKGQEGTESDSMSQPYHSARGRLEWSPRVFVKAQEKKSSPNNTG